MGQRISFLRNNEHKGFKDLLFEHFTPFREWYLEMDRSSQEEFNETFGEESIKNYLASTPDFKNDFDQLDKRLIDEITSAFIGYYCDIAAEAQDLLELFGPTMKVHSYASSTEMILAANDREFIQLWNYLINDGRSLKDLQVFDSYTNEFRIGFLTDDECRRLKEKIEHYFGDFQTIQEKYWTPLEKRQWNARTSGTSLSGYNPQSSGLEFFLHALEEMTSNNIELITVIE